MFVLFQPTTQEGAPVPQHDHINPRSRGRRLATWAVVSVAAMLALSGCELGEFKDGYLPNGITDNSERVRDGGSAWSRPRLRCGSAA